MGLKDDLIKNVADIIAAKREIRDGRKVPESADVGLIGVAVQLDAVFLYADLRDSTSLGARDKNVASDVFQVFLSTMSRIIKAEGGEIRSFDGDRVMAVFIGDTRHDAAARCALKMSWAFVNIVKPKLEAAFPRVWQATRWAIQLESTWAKCGQFAVAFATTTISFGSGVRRISARS